MKKTLLQRHCIHWIVFLYCSVFANLCSAQLNRHWAQLFNEEASLVAGSVVGGGAASSSIYYNPASISEFTDNRLAVNASLFTLQYYQATNALGDEYDLTDFEFDVYPRFVAYIIESKKHPRRKMEVAILTKNNTNFRFEDYIQQKVDVNSSLPGAENHITGFSNRQRFNETWAGLGSSHEINNTFSIGWSIFGIYKFMEYRNSQNIKVIPETDSVRINGNWVPTYVSEITEAEWFRINNYRALLKVGGLWNFDRWSLGWNLTSPSLLVFSGASEASFERTATNIRTETGALPQSSSYIEYQDNMHSDFKDPGSVAIGVTFKGDDANSVLSVSAEYFFELETYKLLDASGSNGVSSNEILSNAGAAEPLTYVHGAKPVLNVAIGYKWYVSEKLKVLTGFRTDFNYMKDNEPENSQAFNSLQQLNFDVYHVSGGSRLSFKNHHIFAGLQYSFGLENDQLQFMNVSDIDEYNAIEGKPYQGAKKNNVDVFYQSFSLFFGVNFNFINSAQ